MAQADRQRRTMHRQVLVLASAQALFQTVAVLVITVGALAGQQIASRPSLATLPIATMFLGTAVAMFPASAFMARTGRRAGFLLGALLGLAGGLTAALGTHLHLLPLLALGTFLVGIYQAFAQFYRFAASEVADDVFRPRAIALVLGGGIVAAVLGPILGRAGGHLLATLYTGSFLLLALVSLLAVCVLAALQTPPGATSSIQGEARPWRLIVSQPSYLGALLGAATGYGVMILAMTATPLAMGHHHHGLDATATVIQLHVLGMFLPSFFTGALIARFGVLRVMLSGVALLAGHVLMSWTGTKLMSFTSALILLGVGWNFLFVGGTTLLTTTYSPAEKSRAQATNDLTVFAVGLVCSFGAGPLLDALGWEKLNALLLPWLGLTALMLIALHLHSQRSTLPVPAADAGS